MIKIRSGDFDWHRIHLIGEEVVVVAEVVQS